MEGNSRRLFLLLGIEEKKREGERDNKNDRIQGRHHQENQTFFKHRPNIGFSQRYYKDEQRGNKIWSILRRDLIKTDYLKTMPQRQFNDILPRQLRMTEKMNQRGRRGTKSQTTTAKGEPIANFHVASILSFFRNITLLSL